MAPGAQGFTAGMTLSQALHRAGGLKPDSYLAEVLVSRLEADSTRTQLRATLRDTTGAVRAMISCCATTTRCAYSPERISVPRGMWRSAARCAGPGSTRSAKGSPCAISYCSRAGWRSARIFARQR